MMHLQKNYNLYIIRYIIKILLHCERTCQYDAIHVEDKLAKIDYEKCVSCGACVEACPVKCISMAQPTSGGTVAEQNKTC